MKLITKDRIIKALDRVQKNRDRSCSSDMNLIQSFATAGFKSMAGCLTSLDHQKLDLELDYHQAPRTPEELEALMHDTFKRLNYYSNWTERVFSIQERYNISGLAPTTLKLGDRTIEHEWEDDRLRFIESDLERLNYWKPILVEAWLDYVLLNELTIYERKNGNWVEVDASMVTAALPFYQWTRISEGIHYTSPSVIAKQGYDSCRRQPQHWDDKKHWEVDLTLGCGTDTDSGDTPYVWFCACNERPHN